MRIDMSRVIEIGDVIKESVERFKEMEEKSKVFSAKMREEMAQLSPETCDVHPKIELELDEEQSIGRSWKPGKLCVCYKPCPECQRELQDCLVNEKMTRIGIPEKVKHATLDNYEAKTESQKKALAKVKRQIGIGSGFLVLRGTPGTGKTHLAAATLKIEGGLFVTEADLIGELRHTYSTNEGQDAMVEKYRSAPILVLDELTIDVVGKDIPALLYRILADRYDKSLLTVITSNETLETIVSILGARLVDRMKANMSVVTCEWESNRKKPQ
jgi:DNA replication protein DnaC